MAVSQELISTLCLECGLCCNGVLFKDVELQSGDSAVRLQALGLVLKPGRQSSASGPKKVGRLTRFPQPCAALCADNRCRLYSDRPKRCRDFECALLKAASAGHIEQAHALRLIRSARRRVATVMRLLRALGETNEHLPLRRRFQAISRRMESEAQDTDAAEQYSRLTLAMHQLNMLLAERFYPGQS